MLCIDIDTLLLGVLTIILMENLLVSDDRQDILARYRILLNLILQPRLARVGSRVEAMLGNVVKRYSETLVSTILIVVFVLKLCLLLLCNHTPHQLHCRILLAGIAHLLCLYHDLVEVVGVRLQLYDKIVCLIANIHVLRLVTYGRESNVHTAMTSNGEHTPPV